MNDQLIVIKELILIDIHFQSSDLNPHSLTEFDRVSFQFRILDKGLFLIAKQ